MRLQGRVAIITGASRGIGRACALALAREGCDVVLAAKTTDAAPNPKLPGTIDSVAREVQALGRRALAVKCDVRQVAEIEAMVERAAGEFGRIDILVNNAGAAWWHPVMETPEKRWDLVMEINAKGPFFAARAVLPHMIQRRWGHIVNMSPPVKASMAEDKVAYMISKFGMTFLAHGLAGEMRPHNVAVHALWPVTLIESYATINFQLGGPEHWRKADILADATVELCARDPSASTGRAWLDEEILREAGITDFGKYACVPGTTPMAIPW
jgi:citronellol/citronellal dehydrogenase